jgi:hypothetical protein
MKKLDKKRTKRSIARNGYFTRIPVEDQTVGPEVSLWRSVLDRAILDLFENDLQGPVISWVCDDYADNEQDLKGSFEDVCSLALLPKQFVYKIFIDFIFMIEDGDVRRFPRIDSTTIFPGITED